MKTKYLLLSIAPLFIGCSELGKVEGRITKSTEGGDVARTLQFQNYRFRTGAAFKAAQLGAIGVKRTVGPNVFEIKRIPKLHSLELSRSASFVKTEGSDFKFLGDLSLSEIKGLDAEIGANRTATRAESGIYTIYYLPNVYDLVEQLNRDENAEVKRYLQESPDFRIVTAVVKVNAHSLLVKKQSEVDFKAALAAFSKEGSAQADTKPSEATGEAKVVTITDKANGEPLGLKIADGGTYAYEVSRVIWDKKSGKVVDLLVDMPGRWYVPFDHANHHFGEATHDPRKLRKL